MSSSLSIFTKSQKTISLIITTVLLVSLLSGCAKSCNSEKAKMVGDSVRLTSGSFQDIQVAFHPTKKRLLAVRHYSDSDTEDMLAPKSPLERKIIEVDFRKELYPKIREIEELAGGTYPTYANDGSIVALDVSGQLVHIDDIGDDPKEITVTGIGGDLQNPVFHLMVKKLLFLAMQTPEKKPLGEKIDLSEFRHAAYMIKLQDKQKHEAKQLKVVLGKSFRLNNISWANNDEVLLTYDVFGPKDRTTRIEKININDKSSKLVLFTDYKTPISAPHNAEFFITNKEKPEHLSFITNDMSQKLNVDVQGQMADFKIAMNGKYSAISRAFKDDNSISLLLVKTPNEILPKK